MKPETTKLVLKALDEALAEHVCKLFAVLITDAATGEARFYRGIEKATELYEEVRGELEGE